MYYIILMVVATKKYVVFQNEMNLILFFALQYSIPIQLNRVSRAGKYTLPRCILKRIGTLSE